MDKRQKQVDDLLTEIEDTNTKLRHAEKKAEKYHSELVLFSLHPLFPKRLKVSTSKTKYSSLDDFNIVLRAGAAWEMWLSASHTYLCPSSTSNDFGWDGRLPTHKPDFSRCLKYDLEVGGRSWVSYEGSVLNVDKANCITCPMNGDADIGRGQFDILYNAIIYKNNLEDFDNEGNAIEPFVSYETESIFNLKDDYSAFIYNIEWNIDPANIIVDEDSGFPYKLLLNSTDTIEVYIVANTVDDHRKERLEYIISNEGEDYPRCVFDMFDPMDDPCNLLFDRYPGLILFTGLEKDKFTINIEYNEIQYQFETSFPDQEYHRYSESETPFSNTSLIGSFNPNM